jgi:WD40 repeat protein
MVYLLDFTGNMIKKYSNHSAAVNEISIDETGEYLASCSDDGAAFTFTHSVLRVVSCRVVPCRITWASAKGANLALFKANLP